MTETATTTKTITFENVLSLLFPEGPPPAGSAFLRLVDLDRVDVEGYWRKLDAGWQEQRHDRLTFGFSRFTDSLGPERGIGFCPVLTKDVWSLAPAWPLSVVWCGVRSQSDPRLDGVVHRVEAEAVEAAELRLFAHGLDPSIIIREGLRVTAFWLLSEPLDEARAGWLLTKLRARFLGDPALETTRPLIAIPGTRAPRVFPSADVVASLVSTTRRSIETITAWLEGRKG